MPREVAGFGAQSFLIQHPTTVAYSAKRIRWEQGPDPLELAFADAVKEPQKDPGLHNKVGKNGGTVPERHWGYPFLARSPVCVEDSRVPMCLALPGAREPFWVRG